MGLLEKVKSLFGGGEKSLSPTGQAWIGGSDSVETGASLTSPYSQSIWVYTTISTIAEALGQIPFRISRVSADKARRIRALRDSSEPSHREFCRRELGEHVIEDGEVVQLFNRPHRSMDRALFWETVVSWHCLRGEFFIVPVDADGQPVDLAERKPKVSGMLTLSPDMFWHMVIGYELQSWRYTGNPLVSPLPSEMLLPSEVVHCRSANPYLYWRGMSPLTVALLPAQGDYAAEMFMKGLLMNNADTGVIATTEQNLTPEQREQFVAALRERKRKAGTPDRPLFLSSGVKIEKPTISNVDMQFLETRRLLRQEICAVFKVPESLLGFSESKSSALSGGGNALNEEKLTFIENNLQPRCHKYEAAVDPIIKSFDAGLVGWFDIEGLPAMQASRRARVDTAAKIFALGVPLNDINRVYDLGFPMYPWGETGYLPFSVTPAGEAPEMPVEDGEPDESDEAEEAEETPMASMRRLLAKEIPLTPALSQWERENVSLAAEPADTDTARGLAELWQQHMRERAGMVKVFQGKFGKVLNIYRARALEVLEGMADGKSGRAEKRSLIDIIFNAGGFGADVKKALEGPQKSALEKAVVQVLSEIGADPWQMPPAKVAEFIRGRTQPIMGIGDTVRSQLNTSLEEGYDAGETMSQIADRVRGVFTNLGKKEAMRVARTETNVAFSYARHEAMSEVGIEYKAWLSSHGPKVRPGHQLAEDVYMDAPIPIDEPFIVDLNGEGEQLMYPGDTSLGASLGNIINCQCVQVAARKLEEQETFSTYEVPGLGKMHFPKRVAGVEWHKCCAEK